MVDAADWVPVATRERIVLRARVMDEIRAFFSARSVLEVETPQLSAGGTTDPEIESFRVDPGDGPFRFLQTSPEFAMKRLLCAGVGDIFQIARVFRRGESGRIHNPEFSLLEWYRIGFDHWRLMEEVESFCRSVLPGAIEGDAIRVSFREAFLDSVGVDPFEADAGALSRRASEFGLVASHPLDRIRWLDLLFSEAVAAGFPERRLTFVFDFPVERAALARVREGDPPVAERFEVFLGPMELGNGFHELTDAAEQRVRFEREVAGRRAAARPDVAMDARLVAALESGLPACAGVAVGLDRLIMVRAGASRIDEVIAFPWDRA